jgi:hypothetical protein
VIVIKVHPLTGEPLRDERGLCIEAKAGEVGEIVAKIYDNDPTRAYPGYHSEEATKKKIVCDVFKHGDKAFLSGDLMEMDENGYLYFKDRTGDTFRWKGILISLSNSTISYLFPYCKQYCNKYSMSVILFKYCLHVYGVTYLLKKFFFFLLIKEKMCPHLKSKL